MSNSDPKNDMAFDKSNYRLLLIGIAAVILGFILMTGGGSGDPNVFNADEVFSFRRITLAPIVCLAGYMFIIYAIIRKPKGELDD